MKKNSPKVLSAGLVLLTACEKDVFKEEKNEPLLYYCCGDSNCT
jgi:hypothetical protein